MSLIRTIIGWFKSEKPHSQEESVLEPSLKPPVLPPAESKAKKPSTQDVIEDILEGASKDDFLTELRSILPKNPMGTQDDMRTQLKKIAKDTVTNQDHP